MKEALHRFKRTKVLASSNEAARPYPWVCPLCGVRVHHVREFTRYNGSYVSARFDHEANSVRARSCKWFRLGSENSSSGAGPAGPVVASRSAPHLMARVVREKCSLGIFMPRFEGDRGTFDFGDASPAIAPYDLSSVPIAGEVYDVYAQTEPYAVEIRAAGSRPERIPVGAIGEFALFAASTGWGRMLGEDEMLAWNKSYLILAPKLPFAFLQRVNHRILPQLKGGIFESAYFRLPSGADTGVAHAAKAILDREVRMEDLMASIVSPIEAHSCPDRTWLVDAASDGLVIAYSLGQPTPRATAVRLLAPQSGEMEQRVILPACTARGLVRFPMFSGEYGEVRFDAAPDFVLAIKPTTTPGQERRTPWPAFAFGIEKNGSIHAVSLWCADLPELLSQVRRHPAQLADVRVPAGSTVLVELDSRGQPQRRTFSFSETITEQEFTALESALVDMVRDGLASGYGVLVDAGGFGQARILADRPATVKHAMFRSSARSRWLDLVRRAHGILPGARLTPELNRFRAHFRMETQLS